MSDFFNTIYSTSVNAYQVRRTSDAVQDELKSVQGRIQDAAKKGNFNCEVTIPSRLQEHVVSLLCEQGFSCNYNRAGYVVVDWSKKE